MKLANNLQEQVATHLRHRILSGQVGAGTPLYEQALAREFGVSRGPVRDALLILAKEGLLVSRPNVGMRVAAEPSSFKRGVLVRLRREIEGAALTSWFADQSDVLLNELDLNLGKFKELLEIKTQTDAGIARIVELDMAFHHLLVTTADHGSLIDVWLTVVRRLHLRYSKGRNINQIYDEHSAIVRSMREGHAWEALELLHQHIAYRQRDLIEPKT